MNKKLFASLCMLISLTFFAACGKSPASSESEREISLNVDSDTKAEISILVPGGNVNERTMIQCLIDDFAEMYPNVTVNMDYVTVNSYESTIKNLAAAGTLDDIIWSNSPDFYYLVSKNLAMNLNPYIEASEKANVFNVENDFYKEFFDCGTLNGNLYCVPRSADSVVTFLNTKIMTDAGIDMTKVKNGWTWEDFIAACAKVRTYFDANGKSDCYVVDANLTSWLSVCYPMMVSYGAKVLDDKGNVAISSDATKQCLEMVRYMVDNRYICDSTKSSGSSYEAGTSAMLFQSASISLYAERKALKGNVDIVSFPLIDYNSTPKIGCGIAGYCINENTKYADICWQFLNRMLSYDGQQNMGLNGLNVASIRKDLSDFTKANWGKGYETLNLSAYLYGSEYKLDTKFLSEVDTKYKADVTQSVKDMFSNASNASKGIDLCISTAVEDLKDALEL